MNPRLSLYFSEETHEKFKEVKSYLKESSALQKQYRNNSATLVTLIEVFYKLFIVGVPTPHNVKKRSLVLFHKT